MNRYPAKQWIASRLLLPAVLLTIPALAQSAGKATPNPNSQAIGIDRGAPALWQSLLRLHTRASLIMFTAHPDDEDGGVLAYESRAAGADTTLFTLNRGEGGQNVMSADFWDKLGLVRTQELLAADRYYGVHQYFSRVADFGFTKTKQEALDKWGYDRVLYDSVRVVRMTRPLVITSVFAGNVSDGHGQHQVAGEMAQKVYKAAADPNVFPDQIRAGLLPWAPLKVFVRSPFATITNKGVYDYATGHWAPARFRNYVNDTWIEGRPSATLQIPEGAYSPALGQSYLQISRQGLGQQKSQNGGIAIPMPGPDFTAYHLYASRMPASGPETSFFDGIDVSLMGIADYAPLSDQKWIRTLLTAINGDVERAMQTFSVNRPQAIAPQLADGMVATEALMREISQKPMPATARYNMLHELGTKRKQFNTALTQALALSLDAVVTPDSGGNTGGYYRGVPETFLAAIPGQTFHVLVHLANQGTEAVQVRDMHLETDPDKNWTLKASGSIPTALAAAQADNVRFEVAVASEATITRPYFTRPNFEQPYYDILNPAWQNLPFMPYPLSAQATIRYRGADITLDQVVQTVHRVMGYGPVENPLIVSPAISVWVSPKAGVVPLASSSFHVVALIHSNVKGPAVGTVGLQLPTGWTSTPVEAAFSTAHDGDEQEVGFTVRPSKMQAMEYRIVAAASFQGHRYTSGSTTVGYPGLRPYPYYRDAVYRATGVDLHLPHGLRVAYVTGTGDDVPSSLKDIGIDPVFLSAQDIATGDLQQYSTIILGVRAYAARPELKTYNQRLLQYVHDGGTLVVQYNTPEYDHNYGPYPYQLGGNPEKVIDEHSRVVLLQRDFPAFAWPNRITTHDFDGWVEERGHDFMQSWDPRYTALTETHDPGQSPQKGGLLVASYGKGFYVYAGYALYRQLPEGVPGAFRILANLISLSKNPGMHPAAHP